MQKNQLIVAVIILAIVAAGAVYWFSRSGPDQYADDDSASETMQDTNDNSLLSSIESATSTEASVSTSSPQILGDATCTRSFDPAKLKNDKVSITNRQVDLAVKDFGTISIELYDRDAPKTVENFVRLVNSGYYDCLTVHRVAKGFVIQTGDPTGTGAGGESAFGSEFADELNPNSVSFKTGYKKGVVAMANRGPNTNTSQFFIMLEDVPLPNSYTIFGRVTVGQDVVDRIGLVPIEPGQLGPNDGKPKTPVVIERAVLK